MQEAEPSALPLIFCGTTKRKKIISKKLQKTFQKCLTGSAGVCYDYVTINLPISK